ncbi:MAG TPA: lectin-like protein [Polyangiaceae bacterium]
MKTDLRCAALSVLFAAACSSPNADLFSQGSSQHGAAGGAGKAVVSSAGSSAGESPATNDGPVADPSSAGSPATPEVDAAGASNVPNNQGTAGESNVPNNQGTAGDPNTPNNQGTAGAPNTQGTAGSNMGVAGSGQPPQPVCGNGILESGEQCDDAGHEGQDGCDANCKVVCAQHGAGTIESDDYHCYGGYNQADFTGAEQDCVKRGAHLATISSAAENAIARGLVDNSKWLGGYEDVPLTSAGTGNYLWLGGDSVSFSNWAPHEPDPAATHCAGGGGPNALCYQHCISILGDGTWANHRCDIVDGYVCEWDPAGTK